MTKTLTQLLSVTEVAATLHCSRGHVYDLISGGHFTAVDIGAKTKAKTRISASEVEAFIAKRAGGAA